VSLREGYKKTAYSAMCSLQNIRSSCIPSIFRLPAFSTNPRKEIAKSQKVYFWDTGIRNALLNEFTLHPLRSDIGRLWVNWVIAEFAKQNLLGDRRA